MSAVRQVDVGDVGVDLLKSSAPPCFHFHFLVKSVEPDLKVGGIKVSSLDEEPLALICC